MNFLEEITPKTKENKKASKHIKKGQELKYSKDIDAIVKNYSYNSRSSRGITSSN